VLERVQREVRHPGIVRLQNVHEDLACLQFEYVQGWTLTRQILDWHAKGTPDPWFIAGELKRIADILVDVHQIQPKPIVHRDLKPANILVERMPDGKLHFRITDFGIGGFAASEVIRKSRMGTNTNMRNPSMLRGAHSPLYASPQQTKGSIDPNDDVYSLGVVWYQMQTGVLDTGPPTGFDWYDDLVGLGMSDELARLMASCFSSKAEKRPATAKVLVERLDGILAGRVDVKATKVETKPDPVVPPEKKPEPLPDVIKTKTADIALKLIPAGKFLMGSPSGQGRNDEYPQHSVTITKPFYLGVHPVTQGQYTKLIGKNPSHFAATGGGKDKVARMDTSRFPVESVSWVESAQFCNALSKAEGLDPYYKIQGDQVEILGGKGFRLPTEAEWEYACRAGTTTPYGFDGGESELGRYAWFDKNSDQRTHAVGETEPNPFGLHDMHGNVWEWVWDGYEADYYLRTPESDPPGPSQAADRVFRGGSWGNTAEGCRSANRSSITPGSRNGSVGFRVARGQ
jgi:formylglycine-generating enzyme required for sulfatase activity